MPPADEFGPTPGENVQLPDIPSSFSGTETTVTSRQEQTGASMSSTIYRSLKRNR